jgi:hypothetical protein
VHLAQIALTLAALRMLHSRLQTVCLMSFPTDGAFELAFCSVIVHVDFYLKAHGRDMVAGLECEALCKLLLNLQY